MVASLGVDSGYVPYTSYSAKTSYMEEHPEVIQKFTNGLQKGMEICADPYACGDRRCDRASVPGNGSGDHYNDRDALLRTGYLEGESCL